MMTGRSEQRRVLKSSAVRLVIWHYILNPNTVGLRGKGSLTLSSHLYLDMMTDETMVTGRRSPGWVLSLNVSLYAVSVHYRRARISKPLGGSVSIY